MNRTKNILSLYALNVIVLMFLILYLLFGCKKFELERIVMVATGSVTNVSYASCSVQGTIIDKGEKGIDQHGFCWAVTQNPTTANNKTQLGSKSSTGNFSGNLTGLSANTTYYVRAYAQNKDGIFYGDQKSFTTPALKLPTVTTTSVSDITENSAQSGGNITDNGGALVTARGVCWSTSQNPTTANDTTLNGNGIGNFTSSLSELTQDTTYYVRAYATNNVGTAYGNEVSFTTFAGTLTPPTAAAAAATSVTNTTATLNGAVNANGSNTIVTFEYGTTILYGSTATAAQSPVTGVSATTVDATLIGLTPGTLYHFRVKVVSAKGTAYSDDLSFTTQQLPTATTEAAIYITPTTATLNGTVNATNLSTTVIFEYGTTISYGLTVTAVPNPVTGGNATSVSADISGLTSGTTYHFRVKAVNTGGTTYGDDQAFTTLCTAPTAITDAATNPGITTFTLNGTVNANNFSTIVTFEYGTNTSYGSTITATPSPVTGNSNTAVSAEVTGLTSNIIYHYRVKAVNCGGTTYGTDQTLTPLSETAINDTLVLCYSKLYEYVELKYLFDAVYSNNIPSPNSSWIEIYEHTQSANNEKILMLWSKAYDIIYKTNFILESSEIYIPDQLTRDIFNAQAKAIRAYLFYNLMIWFGEIPLETGISESMNPRNSIEEVLVQIEQDAAKAAQSLPLSWPTSDKFRIPQSFPNGLLARASLYSKSYNEAQSSSQKIINSGMYALSADTNNFSSTNSEIFWGFEKRDNTEFNDFFTKGSYVPVIRLTESYLISAEAYFNVGDMVNAITYINNLIVRRDKPPVVSLSNDEIFQHWNTELAKEGSMFITMKRFNKAINILQIDTYRLLLPVPISFLDKNPNLFQNPGY